MLWRSGIGDSSCAGLSTSLPRSLNINYARSQIRCRRLMVKDPTYLSLSEPGLSVTSADPENPAAASPAASPVGVAGANVSELRMLHVDSKFTSFTICSVV